MGRSIRILVVEDESSLCDLLSEIFKSEGYEFEIHEKADDILALIQSFAPNIVLLDYLLSSSNGCEICAQIKANPQTAKVPVIIYSAIVKARLPLDSCNADAFIEKPFDLDFLLAEIRRLSTPEHVCLNK